MLSLKECMEFSDLDVDEIAAVAHHEHVPDIVATEMANEMLQSTEGLCCLHTMLLDDIESALNHANYELARELVGHYQQFCHRHPLP